MEPNIPGDDTPTRLKGPLGPGEPGTVGGGPDDSLESAEFATATPSTTRGGGGASKGAAAIKLILEGRLPRVPKLGMAEAGFSCAGLCEPVEAPEAEP